MKKIIFLFFIAVSLVISGTLFVVQAQTTGTHYYVSTTGSDTAQGTLSQPFKTIQYGISKLTPGDTLFVRGGTYYERVRFNKSGTATSPITLSAYNGEKAIIDGTNVSFGTDPENERLVGLYGMYTILKGFEIRNSPGKGISIDADHVTVENNKVHDTYRYGIGSMGKSNGKVIGNEVWNTMMKNVDGNYFKGEGGWDANVTFKGVNTFLIQGNKVHNTWGEGIMCWGNSDNCTIRNNIVYDNYSVNIYIASAHNSLVENNLIYETETAPIEINKQENKKIASAITINSEDGTCYAKKTTVRNNIIIRARTGITYQKYKTGCTGLINLTAEHNTFVNTWGYTLNIGNNSVDTGESTGNIIKNNIFVRNAAQYSTVTGFVNYYNPTGIPFIPPVFERNIFYDASGLGTEDFKFNGTNYAFDAVPTTHASFKNTITTNPQFVTGTGLSAAAYKIKSTSPAVNAALNTTVTHDYFGVVRQQADIGAHEYVAPPTPTPTRTPTQTQTPIPTVIPTNTPTIVPSTQSVKGFSLINSTTGTTIPGFSNVSDGEVIDISTIGISTLAIQARTNPDVVGSIIFKVNGTQVKVENTPAYTYTLPTSMLQGGTFTVEAVPYSNSQGTGTIGTKKTVTFLIQQ